MGTVDTCVVPDVLENDPSFGLPSSQLLERLLPEGLGVVTRHPADFKRWFPRLTIRTP